MKRARLLFAAVLLAATSTLLVSGTLPSAAGSGASVADGGSSGAVRIVPHYGKALD